MKIRTRFAPSPTGHVHIGNMRAAIFNWLYARHAGGKFLLRVEDTDRERSTPAAIKTLLEAMDWLGLNVDEAPLYQSSRMDAHLAAAQRLLATGHAYKEDKGGTGQGECIIFKMPGTDVEFTDLVKGTLRKSVADMADFVIVRSNGTPVFHLANVLDDIEQRITHIIRGDDHVENTFRHIALYRALGAPVPHYAHLPMIVNAQGKPYSKRDGDAFVGDFQSKGFFGEALFNYLALLGWSPGDDREVMTRDEMIAAFDLTTVRSSPAQMDLRKLLWMNGEYVRAMRPVEFATLCREELRSINLEIGGNAAAIFSLMQDRIKIRSDVIPAMTFFCTDDYEYDEKAVEKKLLKEGVFQTLEKIADLFQTLESFDTETVNTALHQFVEQGGLKFGDVMPPLRIAVSGQQSGPDLAPVLSILGRAESISRIRKTIVRFNPTSGNRR
ncbi:MAG: glutamate--tRNA ligase [Pontiellaceae bacterium]|jgi:glutamyl-tRNA synthetase|nr:glutamate--tRNA ligase [Pontiellaceae bacterium]